MPKLEGQEVPKTIRPYQFLGLPLDWQGKEHAPADSCPWCGRDGGKFTVTVATGTWGCFVCGEKGNLLTFLRKLWDESDKRTNGASKALAAERGLLDPMTLTVWGVVQSVLDGAWLVPGFSPDGKLCQLYKRIKVGVKDGKERWELRPTPTLAHGLHGLNLWDPKKKIVHLHESWGNALAFWEVARQAKSDGEGGLAFTGTEAASILADANVLAVPNCGAVGEPLKRFLPLFAGKHVVTWFDSDHTREHGGKRIDGAGFAAAKRAAAIFSQARGDKPESMSWYRWGPEGFDPLLKSGYDVRDILNCGADLSSRIGQLQGLLSLVEPVPAEWVPGRVKASGKGGVDVDVEPCSSWAELVNAWRLALHWRQDLSDALATMLAVACSTSQQDDQLFLQVIADAGSAKSRLCDALLTSKNCFALEHLTGFHSGWKDASGEDFSLLSRINHKTLITPEGDVLMSSPHFGVIMSQQRRIFDGSSGASYKNDKTDKRWTGLRTPWILAGTPALLDCDQSRLGDRFLKVIIGQAPADQVEDICMTAGFAAAEAVKVQANGEATSTLSPTMLKAYRMTGGYVDHLRANASELLSQLSHESEMVVRRCYKLAAVCSAIRARPNALAHDSKEKHDTVELPTRLTKQFVRLASCAAVVTGRKGIDADAMRLVHKVALDTCKGRTFEIARRLYTAGQEGLSLPGLAVLTGHSDSSEKSMLLFLSRIKVAESFTLKAGLSSRHRWRLTPRFRQLWEEVMNG